MLLNPYRFLSSEVMSTYLAAAGASGLSGPRFYDTTSYASEVNLTSYTGSSNWTCAWSPDGAYFALGTSDVSGSVYVWRTSDWTAVTIASNPTSKVFHLVFSPDSSMLAVGIQASPYIQVYNTSDWSAKAAPASLPTGTVVGVSFSADSSKLSVSCGGFTIKIYNTSDMTVVSGTPADKTQNQTVFTNDGLYFVTGRSSAPYLRVYSTSTWGLATTPTTSGMTAPARRMVISPDGNWLALSTSIPTVHVFNTATWDQITLPAMALTTNATVSFSNDNKYLAVASNNTTDYIIEVSGWTVSQTLTGNTPQGQEIAYSPF